MPFVRYGGLRCFSFGIFPGSISHAVFSRHGGLSPAPWDSLNLGSTVGDDPGRVRQNRQRAFEALGRPADSIFDAWLVHGTHALCATAPRRGDVECQKADIILTDRPEVTLFMRFADCVPLLFYDPLRRVIGIAHAGWKGTVRGAARTAVQAMQKNYGSRPADILAAIGPSIGPDHYEVGPDVAGQVRSAFGEAGDRFLHRVGESLHFDLWAANEWILRQAGVERVETAGLCTLCHQEDWFSHRGGHGRTGRFGVLMALHS